MKSVPPKRRYPCPDTDTVCGYQATPGGATGAPGGIDGANRTQNRVERCTQVCLCDCEEFELQMGPEPPITLGPSTESASKMGHISLSLKTSKYPQTAPACGYFTTTCLRIPDTAKKLYPYPVCGYCIMGSLIQKVVFSSEKNHTTTYESDGSRLGGWTILNGPAQKTARVHHFLVENEYVFNV